MNCAECRENLVAWVEGLLEGESACQVRTHLESCAGCRAEAAAIQSLQEQLTVRGRASAEVSLAAPVMRQVRNLNAEREGSSIMSKLFSRWSWGLGAAAGA